MDKKTLTPPLKMEVVVAEAFRPPSSDGNLKVSATASGNSPSPSLQEGKTEDMRRVVEAVLSEVRPALASHGGDAELAKIEGKSVTIALKGSCHGCPMSVMTFGLMVDDMIKRRLPEVEVYYE